MWSAAGARLGVGAPVPVTTGSGRGPPAASRGGCRVSATCSGRAAPARSSTRPHAHRRSESTADPTLRFVMQRSRTLSARRALRGSCAAPSTSHRFVHDGRRVSFGSFQKAIHRALIQRGPAALTLTTSLKDPYGDVYDDGGSPTRIDAGGSACACSQPAPPGAIGGCHRSASPFLRHMAHRHKVFRCLHQQGRIPDGRAEGVGSSQGIEPRVGNRSTAGGGRAAACPVLELADPPVD